MALWNFLDKDGNGFAWEDDGQPVSNWDDGLHLMPGEEGFTDALARDKAKALGEGVMPSYAGTPTWHREQDRLALEQQAKQEREATRANANAQIDAMLNPPSEADGINARFDAMLEQAPDRADDIALLRDRELAALDKAG